jgi:hypothetical protein
MISHAEFMDKFLKKTNNPNLRYSLLGIFVDIFKILTNQKWVSAFARAFSYVDKTGKTNTIISSFQVIYIALVIAFESIGLKMLSFEYDLYTGIDPEKSILNIMKTHSSFMKSVALPMIKVICVCLNIDEPLKMINELIHDEETVKTAKKKAQEGGYPYKSEENGLSTIESYKVELADNEFTKSHSKSGESAGTQAALGIAAEIISGGVVLGTAAKIGTGTTFLGLALSPIVGVVIMCTFILIMLFLAVPVARLVVYWVSVRKIDIQKELELQAELLNNNIVMLQEKLSKTTNKEERVRLQNIINKQIELLVGLQSKIKKYLDEEYEASVAAAKEAEDDDASVPETQGDGNGNDSGDGGFEVDI